MRKIEYDIPFSKDSSAKFIPWVIALTSFISVLFVLGIFLLSSLMQKWNNSLTYNATIQISSYNNSKLTEQQQIKDHVWQILQNNINIEKVTLVTDEEMNGMVYHWLGQDASQHVTMPILFDIKLKKTPYTQVKDALNNLKHTLHTIAPSIQVICHEEWYYKAMQFISLLRTILNIITVLIIFAGVATLSFTTYTGLMVHKKIINVLQMIGAQPHYIGRQFQLYTAKLASKGVLISLIFLFIVASAFKLIVGNIDSGYMQFILLPWWQLCAVVLSSTIVIVAIMALSARITVQWVLNYTNKI